MKVVQKVSSISKVPIIKIQTNSTIKRQVSFFKFLIFLMHCVSYFYILYMIYSLSAISFNRILTCKLLIFCLDFFHQFLMKAWVIGGVKSYFYTKSVSSFCFCAVSKIEVSLFTYCCIIRFNVSSNRERSCFRVAFGLIVNGE